MAIDARAAIDRAVTIETSTPVNTSMAVDAGVPIGGGDGSGVAVGNIMRTLSPVQRAGCPRRGSMTSLDSAMLSSPN